MDQLKGEEGIHQVPLRNGIGKQRRLWNSDCRDRPELVHFESKLEAYTCCQWNGRWLWDGKHGSSVSTMGLLTDVWQYW